MFTLTYKDKIVGSSMLESGDPSICSASGVMTEAGSAIALSQWITENGGVEDDNIFLLQLDQSALVMLKDETPIPFTEGSIICAPEGDEIYLELVGIPRPEYEKFFPQHFASMTADGEA